MFSFPYCSQRSREVVPFSVYTVYSIVSPSACVHGTIRMYLHVRVVCEETTRQVCEPFLDSLLIVETEIE
jgi:hypothetical protein